MIVIHESVCTNHNVVVSLMMVHTKPINNDGKTKSPSSVGRDRVRERERKKGFQMAKRSIYTQGMTWGNLFDLAT